MQISIQHNFADVSKRLQRLEHSIRDRALASAVNKTLDQAQTQMVRGIVREFEVKAAFVRSRLRVRRANKAMAAQITASLSASGRAAGKRAANIIHFVEKKVSLAEARRRAKKGTLQQLFVKVKRGAPAKPLKGAFIGNKGRTVFRRVGEKRLPIEPVQVIDVPQMFNTRRINNLVLAEIRRRFPVIAEREIRYFTGLFNRGGL